MSHKLQTKQTFKFKPKIYMRDTGVLSVLIMFPASSEESGPVWPSLATNKLMVSHFIDTQLYNCTYLLYLHDNIDTLWWHYCISSIVIVYNFTSFILSSGQYAHIIAPSTCLLYFQDNYCHYCTSFTVSPLSDGLITSHSTSLLYLQENTGTVLHFLYCLHRVILNSYLTVNLSDVSKGK